MNRGGHIDASRCKDILYTEEQLKARVAELGKEISKDYQNESVVLVGVLRVLSYSLQI